jgi:hypothetical protein
MAEAHCFQWVPRLVKEGFLTMSSRALIGEIEEKEGKRCRKSGENRRKVEGTWRERGQEGRTGGGKVKPRKKPPGFGQRKEKDRMQRTEPLSPAGDLHPCWPRCFNGTRTSKERLPDVGTLRLYEEEGGREVERKWTRKGDTWSGMDTKGERWRENEAKDGAALTSKRSSSVP